MTASNRRLSCAVTFDFDAMSVWIGSMKSQNPSMISRGEFGAVAAVRILEFLRRRRLRTSWCVPGHTALAYPDIVRRIPDEGHELVHHGWVHENSASFDEAGERRVLERGLEALEKVGGERPRGYRSPAWDLSPRSPDLLLEYGFDYDSSCMGSDFYPYYLRRGDRWSLDEPYVFGESIPLIELPVTWGLDDFPPFEFILGSNTGLSAPSAVEEIWRGDFDFAFANCRGGLFNLTLHPQVIGRGHRMLLLERLISHFENQDGVVFEPLGDYARRWRDENPLETWKKANPAFAGPR